MINFANIIDAMQLVFSFNTMIWAAFGVAVGVGVGAMPGLSPAPAIALLLPLTFTLSLPASLGLLIGVYKGGIYGGSVSAISFATPGTAEAGATVLDGYQLMQAGKGKKALHMALYASVTGDLFGSVVTILLAPVLAVFALNFGPSELLWLMVFAIALIGALSGDHMAKGMLAAALGLYFAVIGPDPVSMVPRNTFGLWWLSNGVGLIPLIIGLFAFGRMLEQLITNMLAKNKTVANMHEKVIRHIGRRDEPLTFKEYKQCWKELSIGTGVGTFVGILPGLGSTVGAYLSYGVACQMSPGKKIGTGKLEGVAAAESGNNATAGPTLVPLLAFGIPGGTVAALIGAALSIQGVQAGPRMFDLYPTQIYAIFIILIVSNVLLFVGGKVFAGFYAKLGHLPSGILIPVVMAMALVGAYSYQSNPFDVAIALFFGVLGCFMRLTHIPEAPLIITFILTPLAEENLRRALMINRGNWMHALFDSPLAIGLAISAIALVFIVAIGRARTNLKLRKHKGPGSSS